MKILLFGKDGQLGWELQRALAPLGEVIACGRAEADFADPDAACVLVRRHTPEIVINAAAYTAVDRAESEPELARRINNESVGRLAQEVRGIKAWLVHYSTDYVFDGAKDGPYTESDPTAPLSVYGRTKRDGEEAIRAAGCKHLILRTSWVYAARGENFVKTILRLAKERDSINVVSDQVGAPTSAELVADITALCMYRLTHCHALAKRASGTYHLTASGQTNWQRYARLIIAEAVRYGAIIRLGPEGVTPIPTSEYPLPAKRPLNSRLDTKKICDAFGVALPLWPVHVKRMVSELVYVGSI
ncbi:MAG: dTDP-4-dehydrorhamnose reductase [Proteobacteria bacterium]|nr:dTDP-4-dehydrorhamnose reductase [Pseudomonadota bacterium]MBU1450611.1 dTDP-4-dehydrorhamnose reductase [Pseudomonadota bacterium]MBU2469190.1 dTDP-4-dehydrorhamnose reductase [Pseudomonadota bacterium]MBU2518692.1 dTDP-4-dehydrorhamnose reductase [Pseudomonadota bacterium]